MEQDLYLEADFWKAFDIAPQIFPVEQIDSILQRQIHGNYESKNPKMHDLNEKQQIKLNEVVQNFPVFKERDLGCTKIEKHSIKLIEGATPAKNRHYPLSPAVQEIVYEEVDNMLALNVRE